MRLSRLLIATAVALSLASPLSAKTLRWASVGDALTLDPHAQNEGPTSAMAQHIYDPLIQRDPSLKKIPNLALSWKPIAPTVWEFKLRPGVTFSDGSPFTADDVVFSINRVLSPTSDFKTYLASVKEAKAIDPLTVHMVTDGPNPILPDQLTNIFIMSKAWCEKHNVAKPQSYKDKEETFAVRNAMGTGPFMVKQRDPDIKTVLVKNPAYWGKDEFKDYPDELVYTPIKEPATRVAALISGQLDFVLDVQLQDVARVKQTPGLKTLETAQIRSIFLGLDVGSPELKYSDVKGKNPFADKRVREAMYKAIDINAIKTKVMRNFSAPAGLITPKGVSGWTKELDARQPYDVAGAKKLMAEAGYGNGFRVTLDCPNDRYNNDEAICQAVVGMLAQIGIQIDLQARSKTLHFPKLQKKDSSFYLLGWGVPTLDSHYVFSFMYQTNDGKKNGAWNFTGYSDPKLDGLIGKMAQETDIEKRDGEIAEAWKIARDSSIYLPLHHQVIVWSMSDKVDTPIFATDSPNFRYAKMK
ncbi:ABC transporter substrate-binding protein [Vineibacter terrae]|uniref:ABC transporter substrate-binding protein n=1 Tax=Vineibacter terrae TaxID=2586908 RepID=A0A5C8PNR1_9HYPH|nr:ABC transporter substrate-binding protein [Vineibacter terrae]TXL76336.1 ABC transporter substrate-binding protein [Vineibacter terrae]